MTEIRFYHLQKQTLDQGLPLIVEKAFSGGHKILIRLHDDKEVERMNALLWTYKPHSFLPHGSAKNGQAEAQPIWLTAKDENPNHANVIILTQGAQTDALDTYSLCCDMIDGRDESAVDAARKRWKSYQEAGHDVTYWYQSETGAWAKK